MGSNKGSVVVDFGVGTSTSSGSGMVEGSGIQELITVRVHDEVGDLLAQPVQALVNPWSRYLIPRFLLWPQGVSGALKKQTGPGPWRELARHGRMSLGEAAADA